MIEPLPTEYLEIVRKRCISATTGPWILSVEGRDHPLGGDTVILRGINRAEDDLYLIGGTVNDYDFVANAKQDISLLLDEIERLRSLLANK